MCPLQLCFMEGFRIHKGQQISACWAEQHLTQDCLLFMPLCDSRCYKCDCLLSLLFIVVLSSVWFVTGYKSYKFTARNIILKVNIATFKLLLLNGLIWGISKTWWDMMNISKPSKAARLTLVNFFQILHFYTYSHTHTMVVVRNELTNYAKCSGRFLSILKSTDSADDAEGHRPRPFATSQYVLFHIFYIIRTFLIRYFSINFGTKNRKTAVVLVTIPKSLV